MYHILKKYPKCISTMYLPQEKDQASVDVLLDILSVETLILSYKMTLDRRSSRDQMHKMFFLVDLESFYGFPFCFEEKLVVFCLVLQDYQVRSHAKGSGQSLRDNQRSEISAWASTPWKINGWNLQITNLERTMIFQTSMIMLFILVFRGVYLWVYVSCMRCYRYYSDMCCPIFQ